MPSLSVYRACQNLPSHFRLMMFEYNLCQHRRIAIRGQSTSVNTTLNADVFKGQKVRVSYRSSFHPDNGRLGQSMSTSSWTCADKECRWALSDAVALLGIQAFQSPASVYLVTFPCVYGGRSYCVFWIPPARYSYCQIRSTLETFSAISLQRSH